MFINASLMHNSGIWSATLNYYLSSAGLLTECCCFWPVAPCKPSAPHGPGGFWNWWPVSLGTGTPSRTPSALSGHQGEPSSERTASNEVKHALPPLTWAGLHIVCLFVCPRPGEQNSPLWFLADRTRSSIDCDTHSARNTHQNTSRSPWTWGPSGTWRRSGSVGSPALSAAPGSSESHGLEGSQH